MKVRRFREGSLFVIEISGSERQRNRSCSEPEFHLRGCRFKANRLRINISAFASSSNLLAAVYYGEDRVGAVNEAIQPHICRCSDHHAEER